MMPDFTAILNTSELRLSLNLLGYHQWDDIPLIQTDESIEQRVMNAFVHLVECGRLVPGDGGYRFEPEFRQVLQLIGRADRVYHVCVQDRIWAFIYETNECLAVIAPDWGNPARCRISTFSDTAVESMTEWLARSPEEAHELTLRQTDPSAGVIGTYDAEKLAYFLGARDRMEDSE